LTAVYDPGGLGVRDESYERIRAVRDADGGLTVRIYHTLSAGAPAAPAEAEALIEKLEGARPFQGDEWVDMIGLGEIYYAPFHWDDTVRATSPGAEDVAAARRILAAAARAGWPVQTHATQPQTIDHLLDVMEEINAEHPLRQLRWSITHADNIGAPQIERARRLGMNLQMRSTPVIGARAGVVAAFGQEAALEMPPLRLVRDSGIPFGLGTDGTKAAQINPFVTLWWAVTGRSLDGGTVLRQTLTREQALIAHTRANARLMFQEANLGAIKPGLLADMLVLDRDYLGVPAEEIKDIRPVAVIVGGRIVHGRL
jgi:predicted amidohydrolase YtcJ